MAMGTACQTPGAIFHTHVGALQISVTVDIPVTGHHLADLTEAEAELLEANLHNAVELVLARYFK